MPLAMPKFCRTDDEPPDQAERRTPMSASESPSLNQSHFANYRTCAGAYDELTDSTGQIRPHWAALIDSLQRLGPEELAVRQENSQRVIREHGATYNVYADGDRLGRPWSLDLL